MDRGAAEGDLLGNQDRHLRSEPLRAHIEKGPPFHLDFKRYTLPNGLQVILHEDHKAPIVHLAVWYHVGSKDEPTERTGFAHLFEHMMFQGSEHIGKAEHFSYVHGVGGVLNATTSQDRTNYYQTLPSNQLGLGLWLEADRMRSLKVTEENYSNQRSVVREERMQRYDNAPYGLWYLAILEMLFGGSQYGWGPIGDMAHLDAAPLEAVQEFHRRFYRPNNALLVLAGSFREDEARRMIAEQFGDIPNGPPAVRPDTAVRPLQQQVRRTITAEVPLPGVYIAFQSVPVGHPDNAPLDILSMIMSRGRSSRLRRKLVYELEYAQNAAMFNRAQERSGIVIISALASPQSSAGAVEELLWQELATIADKGVTPREVEAGLNYVESIFALSMRTMQTVADNLARYQMLHGDAETINSLMEKYRAVTADDIRRTARKYLRPEAAAVLHYLPQDSDPTPSANAGGHAS